MSDINVYVTSDLTSSERKVSPQWSIAYLKTRLEQITGIPPQFQSIHVYRVSNSNEYQVLSDARSYNQQQDEQTHVSDWNIASYGRLHVVDENPDSELKNLAEKEPEQFQLSEEDYAKRSDTVLQWKKNNQLGRFNPEFNEEKSRKLEQEKEAAKNIKVGNRFRTFGIQGERRGSVRFVGKIEPLDNGEGIWIGVEFDEPVGKNNGLIGNINLFSCRDKHGSFLKPQKVEVGDFPEVDPFASDEEL